MTSEISINEVKKHKSSKSLWMVIHNDVYDVTKFLEEHPGGEDTLLENAGKDATQAFEDVGHSEDARELLKKFKIGTLPVNEKKKKIPINCKPCERCNNIRQTNSESKPWRTFDGSSSSRSEMPKPSVKKPKDPKIEQRCNAIVVPTESSNLKWALLALAGALIIGIVLKKTMS